MAFRCLTTTAGNLFSEFWLSFFDCCYKHVSRSCCWQSVKTTLDTFDSNYIQVLCSCVVSTVDDCTYWQSQCNSEFSSCGTSSSSLRHFVGKKEVDIRKCPM